MSAGSLRSVGLMVVAGLAALFVMIVADALAADLQQHRLAVVRPFLHDAVVVAADPDVVSIVDEAAMDRRSA